MLLAILLSLCIPNHACPNGVYDGDTIHLNGEKIRLLDIDTPEIGQPRCTSELALGLRARDRLLQLLNSGSVTLVRQGRDRDRYGRLLRVVKVNGVSVGETLIAEHLARRWDGARHSWC